MDQKTNTNSIFIFIFGFLSGVFVSSFIFLAPLISTLIIFISGTILISEKILNKSIGKEVLFLSLIFLSFGLGAFRYSIKDFHEILIPDSTGIVINEPEQKENSASFVLRADNGEKVLINTDLYSSVQYGDRVEVNGKLQEPGIINEDENRPFDYGKYLSKDDIYFTMKFAKVDIISHGHGNFIKNALFKLKHSFIGKIREILAEPQSSLLAGLIVAGKDAMPKDILEEFRRAGVIHIVVLSGYNITIIAEFMRKIFENFFIWAKIGAGPKTAASASIIGIILFVLMTGAEATVVRAALMVLVVIAAKLFGRAYSAPRALMVVAFLMVLHNPKILVSDPSFQLSFLATCGLIYLSPIFEKLLSQLSWASMRILLATTLATQITVLPFLIYSMGDVSLVSLPANILILLFIPITMLVGFTAALVAYFSSVVAWPLSYVTHLLLSWILGVSNYLGNLSFASISVPLFPFWIVVIIYLIIFIFVRRWQNSLQPS